MLFITLAFVSFTWHCVEPQRLFVSIYSCAPNNLTQQKRWQRIYLDLLSFRCNAMRCAANKKQRVQSGDVISVEVGGVYYT